MIEGDKKSIHYAEDGSDVRVTGGQNWKLNYTLLNAPGQWSEYWGSLYNER